MRPDTGTVWLGNDAPSNIRRSKQACDALSAEHARHLGWECRSCIGGWTLAVVISGVCYLGMFVLLVTLSFRQRKRLWLCRAWLLTAGVCYAAVQRMRCFHSACFSLRNHNPPKAIVDTCHTNVASHKPTVQFLPQFKVFVWQNVTEYLQCCLKISISSKGSFHWYRKHHQVVWKGLRIVHSTSIHN